MPSPETETAERTTDLKCSGNGPKWRHVGMVPPSVRRNSRTGGHAPRSDSNEEVRALRPGGHCRDTDPAEPDTLPTSVTSTGAKRRFSEAQQSCRKGCTSRYLLSSSLFWCGKFQ